MTHVSNMSKTSNTPRAAIRLRFEKLVAEQGLLKVIAGIDNTDLTEVTALVEACEKHAVPAIDIAANSTLIGMVRPLTTAILFASSVDPMTLASAARQGVDVVELGNFDALYKRGEFYSAEQVLQLAKETVELIGDMALISVTIPGHLSDAGQLAMAKELENLGVDVIQTEGTARLVSETPSVKMLNDAEKFETTLKHVKTLTKATRLPIMAASGISESNLTEALQAGACGVGIGSAVRRANNMELAIANTVRTYNDYLAATAEEPALMAAV